MAKKVTPLPPSGMAAAKGAAKRPTNTSTKTARKSGVQVNMSDAAKRISIGKETRRSIGKGKNKVGTTATPGWQKGRGTI